MSDLTSAVDAIAALMRGRRTLAVTGAGISTDAGIPDYRGVGTTPVEPVDYEQFVTDPVWYRWVWARNHATWRLLARSDGSGGESVPPSSKSTQSHLECR